MDLRSVLLELHTALRGAAIEHALIGGLAMAAHGAARATVDLDFLVDGARADAADLIGLKVQASSNDPSRQRRDLADIERLLQFGKVDLARVREYFRLFDREKELDALLAGEPAR